MKANLRYLSSPDVLNLESYKPPEFDNFCLFVQAIIGPSGDKGEESFDFLVCTPRWLEQQLQSEGYIFGRGYIIIKEYNYHQVFELIKKLCDRTSGENWRVIANKIAHYGSWEFDDFQENK